MQPDHRSSEFVPTEDPWRFGWRLVKRTLPEGGETFDEVPLTLEDLLHPEENDKVMHNDYHPWDCVYLAWVCRTRPLSPQFVMITQDRGILWGVAGMRHHSPDVGVFVGLRELPPREQGIVPIALLGGRCLLVMEVVSPGWRVNDVVTKVDHYHQAGVPLYFLIDQEYAGGPRRVIGYQWTPGGYVELPVDDLGRVWVAPLGLWLGVSDQRAACWDGETGKEIGDYGVVTKALLDADTRNEELEQAVTDAVEQTKEARGERDSAIGERDSAIGERDSAIGERDSAIGERDRFRKERDAALEEAKKQEQQRERIEQLAEAADEKVTQAEAEMRVIEEQAQQNIAAAQKQVEVEREQREAAQKAAQAAEESARSAAEQLRQLKALLAQLQGGQTP